MEHRRLEPRPPHDVGRVVVEGTGGERDMVFVPIVPIHPAVVDAQSLQSNMDSNREALRVKLEQRPAKRQLVQRGILPAYPAIGDRVRILQRVHTGDVLRRRIEQRPSRHKLVTQHILVSEATVDALIAEKANRLQRCLIADDLNRKLQHRPGPLDLVDKRILLVDGCEEEAIQARVLNGMEVIAVTSSGYESLPKPGVASSKAGKLRKKRPATSQVAAPYQPSSARVKLLNDSGKQCSAVASPSVVDVASLPTSGNENADSGGMLNSNTLMRPPVLAGNLPRRNEPESSTPVADDEKSSYELLLRQQQLFLQWQQELAQPMPLPPHTCSITVIPSYDYGILQDSTTETVCVLAGGVVAPQSTSSSSMTGVVEEAIATANSSAVSATGAASCGPRSALADWRVPDLRNECKKRQLIVSGAKPVLLERLRPFEAGILADAASATEQPPLDPTPPAACSQPAPLPPICDVIGDYCMQQQQQQQQQQPPQRQLLQMPQQQQIVQLVDGSRAVVTPCRCGSGGSALDVSRASSIYTPSTYSSPGVIDGGSTQSAVVPESTFSFAQMGSGGQFTLAQCGSSEPLRRDETDREQHVPVAGSPVTVICPPGQSSTASALPTETAMPADCQESLLSATQLSIHEEMLRHQQRKVEQLQRELQRSQQQLRHQQHVILAAKKAQSRAQCGTAEEQSVADLWLAQLDTKHLHKFHIQLFLQHKLQQQQMQEAMAEHEELCRAEQRLAEELHVEQAVKDIVRLIKQDARTALLIVQLLRRYQIERQQERIAQENGQRPQDIHQQPLNPSESSETTVADVQNNPVANQTNDGTKPPSKSSKKKKSHGGAIAATRSSSSSVDMEEIFRTVLQDASRALLGTSELPAGASSERTSDKSDNVEADDDETSAKNVPTPEYHYSKNEDMDDLMDVLRDDQEKSLSPSSVLPNEFGFPNTYGTYELNHLFGDDWLDDGSSPSTLFDNSTTTSGQMRATNGGGNDVSAAGIAALCEETAIAADALQHATGVSLVEQNMDWLNEFVITSSDPLGFDFGGRVVHNPLLSQTHSISIDAPAFAV